MPKAFYISTDNIKKGISGVFPGSSKRRNHSDEGK